uniref:Uncharacterized protein n=1 Tax=viral metagenome TaxID=1070528 RepID=A0A6C0D6G6_9ZZZZ
MKHIYTPFLAIFLIFVIIGFSIYKQLNNTKEGLETMVPIDSNAIIITRGKRKVRRRTKSIKVNNKILESYKEGASNPFKKLTDGFKKIGDGFKKIPKFFQAINSYIKCGFTRIKSMPGCMQWYMLEILGKILYTPIRFLVWMISKMGAPEVRQMEKDVWNYLEQIDKMTYSSAGIHIIHYSDEIIDGCYKCKGLVPFPK